MMSRRTLLAIIGSSAVLPACQQSNPNNHSNLRPYSQGPIETFDPSFSSLVAQDTKISLVADGFKWTEGPSWDPRREHLYFSDIPNNRIHSWSHANGLRTFKEPAGRVSEPADPYSASGTNGLLYVPESDSLLICNQDARSVDLLDLSSGKRKSVVDLFQGKRFNSPNDIIRSKNGVIYFTDPPYGLKDQIGFSGREQPHNGVYRFSQDLGLSLITGRMSRPNGIALSPDETTLYVSQSDEMEPIIQAFSLDEFGQPVSDKIFADFSDLMGDHSPGLPDGMAVDRNGNLFATGPGGVTIINPDGMRLGRIFTGRATANCAFGEDGSTLFMTAHDTLLSIPTLTSGLGQSQ